MGCVDQIQQTLKSEHPAKPFGAVADRGFETTPQLSFAQADLVGQCRHRMVRPCSQRGDCPRDRPVDHRVGGSELVG